MYSRLIWEAETEEEVTTEELEKVKGTLEEYTRKASRDLKLAAVALVTAVSSGALYSIILQKQTEKHKGELPLAFGYKDVLKVIDKFAKVMLHALTAISLTTLVVSVIFFILYLVDKSKMRKLTNESYIHESWILTEAEDEESPSILEKIKVFFANKKGATSKLGDKVKAFFSSKTGKILGGASLLALVVFAFLIVKKVVASEKSIGQFVIDILKSIKSHPWSLGVALVVISIAGIVYLIYRKKKGPDDGSGSNSAEAEAEVNNKTKEEARSSSAT
jgi:hypothetical protein